MMPFTLTEHAVMRFLQRKKAKLNKDKNRKDDHFDSYLALKLEAEQSLLIYVSEDHQTIPIFLTTKYKFGWCGNS